MTETKRCAHCHGRGCSKCVGGCMECGQTVPVSEPTLQGKVEEILQEYLLGDKYATLSGVSSAILALVENPTPTPPPTDVCCENGNFGDGHECLKQETPTEWEQRFDREFEYADFPKNMAGHRSDVRIKAFITQALAEHKARMVEEVENASTFTKRTYALTGELVENTVYVDRDFIIKALSK